ncbi:type II toxin-antitoxin system toxin DNA ADP-ribosyl transferase DarT [Segnochrobactraceae bacterium EtOH-i3]
MAANPLILSPDKASIFRITHIDNIPWILRYGLHCRNAKRIDPNFINIGNVELIKKRATREITTQPGGTLADYIPFYFTPYSPMFYNIHTGYNGIKRVSNSEIIFIVSSLKLLHKNNRSFLFTDRHASLKTACFFSSLSDLDKIDWDILRSRDFRRDPDDPDKMARYEAEALVHRHLPIQDVAGIVCYSENEVRTIEGACKAAGVEINVVARPGWYF